MKSLYQRIWLYEGKYAKKGMDNEIPHEASNFLHRPYRIFNLLI